MPVQADQDSEEMDGLANNQDNCENNIKFD